MVEDRRALKVLFDTYWCSKGWKSAGKPGWTPQTPPEDYDYAIRAGVMFPARTPCSIKLACCAPEFLRIVSAQRLSRALHLAGSASGPD